jgi:hypothetical protein
MIIDAQYELYLCTQGTMTDSPNWETLLSTTTLTITSIREAVAFVRVAKSDPLKAQITVW